MKIYLSFTIVLALLSILPAFHIEQRKQLLSLSKIQNIHYSKTFQNRNRLLLSPEAQNMLELMNNGYQPIVPFPFVILTMVALAVFLQSSTLKLLSRF